MGYLQPDRDDQRKLWLAGERCCELGRLQHAMTQRVQNEVARSLSGMADPADTPRRRGPPFRFVLLFIGAVAAFVGAATPANQYLSLGPASDAHRAELVTELNALPAPAGAVLLELS
jgi:hypothetical protein